MKSYYLILPTILLLHLALAGCTATSSLSTITPTSGITNIPANTSTAIATIEPTPTPTPNRIGDFALSPDGSKIAIFTNDGIFIYDTSTLEKTLFSDDRGNGNCNGAVAFNPDGTAMAFTSTYPANYVYIENVNTGELLWKTYDIPNGQCVSEMDFSPEGNTIFVRSTYVESTARCEFSEDTLELYSLDRQSTFFYESRMFQMWWCRESRATIKFLSSGKFYLFFYTESKSWVSVGDSGTGQIIEQYEYDISKDGWHYDISQDGQALAVSPSVTMFENPTTNIVDPVSRKSLMTVPYYVKLLKEKDQFIVYDLHNTWKFWKNDNVVCSYDFATYPKLKFNADYNLMAAHTGDNQIEIWKVSTCEKISTISVSE